MPSIQIGNETGDEDMDQDTPHSDRSHNHESESASGTENEVQANHPVIDCKASRT